MTIKRAHQPCPRCTSSDAYTEYTNGGKCFSCGYYKPFKSLDNIINLQKVSEPDTIRILPLIDKELTLRPSLHWTRYLAKMGFNLPSLHLKYGLYLARNVNDRADERLIIPFADNKNYTARSLTQQPKWLHGINDLRQCYLYTNRTDKNLILVEDPMSYFKLLERTSYSVLCLLGTTFKEVFLSIVLKHHAIYIWLDDDDAGQRAASKIKKRLQTLRDCTIIKTREDPKYITKFEDILL